MRLPLTIAIDRDKVNYKLVVLLNEAYPVGIREAGPNGRLALHAAVDQAKPSIASIRYLSKAAPDTILTPTRPDRLDSPLALAAGRRNSEVTRSLLLAIPHQDPVALRNLNWEARRIAFVLSRLDPVLSAASRESFTGSQRLHGRRVAIGAYSVAATNGTGSDCESDSESVLATSRRDDSFNFFSRLHAANMDIWRIAVTFL